MDLDNITQSLIVSAKLGNQEALNELFARYQSRVLRVVRHRLSQEQRFRLKLQSMDIVQEVFMYALQHLKDFEPESKGHFLNWLSLKVKHYICDRIDFMSRDKRVAPGGEVSMDQEITQSSGKYQIQIAANSPTPSQFAVSKEREELIDSMLDQLEPEQREVIVHRDLEELSFPEIGKILGKSEEAVRKQYCRAFKRLIELTEEKVQPIMAEETYRKFTHGI